MWGVFGERYIIMGVFGGRVLRGMVGDFWNFIWIYRFMKLNIFWINLCLIVIFGIKVIGNVKVDIIRIFNKYRV